MLYKVTQQREKGLPEPASSTSHFDAHPKAAIANRVMGTLWGYTDGGASGTLRRNIFTEWGGGPISATQV